ncbi:MAG: TolC family protein [Pseudomonadota bacterium]
MKTIFQNASKHFLPLFLFLCFGSPVFSASNNDSGEILDLKTCINIVIDKNPSLALTRYELAQRKAAGRSVKKDLLPTLSSQYAYIHQPDSLLLPEDQFSYGFTAEQPLYRGKSLVTAVNQAELSVESAQLAIEETVNNLVYDVHVRYFALLRAEKIMEESSQAVLRLQSHVKDATAFYNAGLIPKNDLLQSEVELAQGEQDLVDAENELLMATSQLNVLMRRPVGTPLHLADMTEHSSLEAKWEDIVEYARSSRAEIARSDRDVKRAENDIILKKAPYLPSVSLSASYEKIGDEFTGAPYQGGPSEVKTIMAIASWKLWTWRKDRDDVLAAEQNLKKAEKYVDIIVDEVTIDARNSFLHLEQAAKRITVAEKTIEHARENFRINQAQYQAQLSTSTDVLDAQSLLTRAMTNYYDALYGYQLAVAAVDKAKGTFGQLYMAKNE